MRDQGMPGVPGHSNGLMTQVRRATVSSEAPAKAARINNMIQTAMTNHRDGTPIIDAPEPARSFAITDILGSLIIALAIAIGASAIGKGTSEAARIAGDASLKVSAMAAKACEKDGRYVACAEGPSVPSVVK